MRTITFRITENPAKSEIETYMDIGKASDGTPTEHKAALFFSQKFIAAISPNAKAIVTDLTGKVTQEKLRQKARVQVDIQEAGQ